MRTALVVVVGLLMVACGHDAQLRRERLASPDCRRPGADPETCGGLGEAKGATKTTSASGSGESSGGQSTVSKVLEVISAGAGGFLDGARSAPGGGSGCVNSYGCQHGMVCVIPQGSTTGTCATVR